MQAVLEINDPVRWRAKDIAAATDWIHTFTPAEIAEIDAACETAIARGRDFDTLTREDFPLPTVSRRIAVALDGLENNRGMYLFRGFPVMERSPDELRFLFWGLGQHFGAIRSQSYQGDYLGDVKDFGGSRIYTSSSQGYFHVDFVDAVALFVMRPAKSGGLTQICNSIAIHDEIARTRPDLLDALYDDVSWSSSRPASMPGPRWFRMPVFSSCRDRFSCLFIPAKLRRAPSEGAPPQRPELEEAIELIEEISQRDDFQLKMMFEPGDLQLINNHVCLHGRTAFTDFDEPDRRRHLLRLWFSPANSRELDPRRAAFGDTRAGAPRGGVGNDSGKRVYASGRGVQD